MKIVLITLAGLIVTFVIIALVMRVVMKKTWKEIADYIWLFFPPY